MRGLQKTFQTSLLGSNLRCTLHLPKCYAPVPGVTVPSKSTQRGLFVYNCVRFYSESAEPLPLPTKEVPEKVKNIVEEIGQLNLREISQLNSHLKETLGLSDLQMMPMGGMHPPQEEDEKPPPQTHFTIKLVGFDGEKKIKLIKEIKSLLPDLNLVQAKQFVENCPGVVRKDVEVEEARKLEELLKSLGGKVELE